MRPIHVGAILVGTIVLGCSMLGLKPVHAQSFAPEVEALFSERATHARVMQVEAAIALSQAEFGLVSERGAREIADKAHPDFAPTDEIRAEQARVRHRMVALLNVWRRSLGPEASNALHLGVTTVDIYDTVLILQLLDASEKMIDALARFEQELVCLALPHRATPMIGRTLGQHALPITFGKKVATWTALNRRNIDRLHEVRARLRSAGVLKGAVGSHLGLSDQGIEVERGVARRLGLDEPEPADWRASRDVFAEYAQTLALLAKSLSAFGHEVFRLQTTDIGELYEKRPTSAVGSSTMPHKRNPSLSEALMHHGRMIPALASVLLDDVESSFERDNTSRPNRTLAELSIQAADAIDDARRLLGRLEINEKRMRANLDRTDGMIMSQRLVLFLAERMDRDEAEARVRDAAAVSMARETAFRDALLEDPILAPLIAAQLEALLDPTSALGLAPEQVDRTIEWIDERRYARSEPSLHACASDN
ncbi:MAG: lyase family protein [Wenzhouxiangellaceae bacterium]|nr:lyase family protein [Wenzhouxiangellaceae bacterium]